jgi:hypothetical protein
LVLCAHDQEPEDYRQFANRQLPDNPGNNMGQQAEGDNAIRQVAKTRNDQQDA